VAEPLKAAGQPFTFSGVARYATARVGRLLTVALLFGSVFTVAIGGLAGHCWWPVITEAVEALPENGAIARGALQLPEKDARLLAANQFLSLQIALGNAIEEAAPVDIAIELGKYELTIRSVLGESPLPYPDGWNIPLGRNVVWPLWGAWKGPMLAAFCAGSLLLLILSWFVLALLYAPIVLALAGLARRELTFGPAWKMGVAAQWPASLLMVFAVALYSTGEIGLLFVIIMFFAHFIPTILNVLIAPFFLPKLSKKEKTAPKGNPFGGKKRKRSRNPFRGEDE
jgi:hypothetical protein